MAVPLIEWGFEEASGAVVNSGSGGSTYNYTPSGNVARTSAGGGDTMGGSVPNSKGLTVTGTDVVTGPFNSAMNSNARTMIVGIKTSSSDPAWTIEMRRTAEDTGVFGLLNLSGTLRFRAKNSSNTAFERTITADSSAYHYIAAVHDGSSTLKVYRDQGSGVATQIGADINMGGLVWDANDFRIFDGAQNATIDNFRYFTSALSAAEIATWMSTPAPSTSATDLVIQDATHATSSDVPTLTRLIDLAIQKAVQAMSTDPVAISQIHQLAIFDSVHATLADNMVLQTGTTLVIQDAVHATSTDGIALVQTHNLQIQDATHTTTADTVQLVGPGFGGFMSVSDVQLQKLQTLTGKTGTTADLEFAYYSGLSGLVPVASYSVTDHQRKYWEAQTGLTGRSMADLEKAFYDGLLIAAGSLADREFTYWTSV